MRNTGAALAGIVLAALVVGCNKSDPVAGTGTDIQISANPAQIDLRTDDTNICGSPACSTITATVFNQNGSLQSGVPLLFTTDTGKMRSGGQRVKTNGSGVARDVLIVGSDDDGKTAKVTVQSGSQKGDISVEVGGSNKPPQAKFSVDPLISHINQPVSFDGSASKDPNGDETIQKMVWTLTSDHPDPSTPSDVEAPDSCTKSADNLTETCTFTRRDSSLKTGFEQTFSHGQILTVRLDVFDDQGLKGTFVQSGIEIDWNTPPVANAGPDITVPACRGVDPPFNGLLSSDPDGTIVRYHWDFGDGGVGEGAAFGHSFNCYALCGNPPEAKPGCSYTVQLTVWDNGAPTAPGYTCNGFTHLCGGTDSGTQSLTGIDTLKVTVVAPVSGTANCPCVCGVDSNGNPNPCP